MIVRSEGFIPRSHQVLLEPVLPDATKLFLHEGDMADSMNHTCCLVNAGFYHGKDKHTSRCAPWQRYPKRDSDHQKCAHKVALNPNRDDIKLTKGKPPGSERDATAGLNVFTLMNEYGIEGEVLVEKATSQQ